MNDKVIYIYIVLYIVVNIYSVIFKCNISYLKQRARSESERLLQEILSKNISIQNNLHSLDNYELELAKLGVDSNQLNDSLMALE